MAKGTYRVPQITPRTEHDLTVLTTLQSILQVLLHSFRPIRHSGWRGSFYSIILSDRFSPPSLPFLANDVRVQLDPQDLQREANRVEGRPRENAGSYAALHAFHAFPPSFAPFSHTRSFRGPMGSRAVSFSARCGREISALSVELVSLHPQSTIQRRSPRVPARCTNRHDGGFARVL